MSSTIASALKFLQTRDALVETLYTEDDNTYRERNSLSGVVHTFHVHVRPEQRHPTVRVAIRLQTLEKTVGIVEDSSTRC